MTNCYLHTESFIRGSICTMERALRIRALSATNTVLVTNAKFSLKRLADDVLVIDEQAAQVTEIATYEKRVNYLLDTSALNTGKYLAQFEAMVDGSKTVLRQFNLEITSGI